MKQMNREKFLSLSSAEIAEMMHIAAAQQVCVFPVNGSRRWFVLEHGQEPCEDQAQAYLDATSKRQIELYQLCFGHGLDTLVTPIFGDELLSRGDDYTESSIQSIARLATHPDFLSFYQKQNVRVHFYGDYRKRLEGTQYAYLCDLFEHLSKHTAHHTQHRLFYGLFASDATDSLAEMAVRHHQNTGHIPNRRALIEQYYGEYIEKANIFIGFEKFKVFDYPMLSLGEENIYFTAAPSIYMGEQQLRKILYDHLFLRPLPNPDLSKMPCDDIAALRKFYQLNQETTFGLGDARGGTWYPDAKILE